MRIIVPPVLVLDRICRITSPVESLLEVEEWTGEWWEPSSMTITTVSQAAPAPEAVLIARGVPAGDRTSQLGADRDSLQHQLRPTQPDGMQVLRIEESNAARHGRRQRQYPGSARFRRGRTIEMTDRRDVGSDGGSDRPWSGPFRRASDRERTDGSGPLAS